MYAKIENGAVVKYPYSFDDLRRDNPNTGFSNSMSQSDLNSYGLYIVVVKGQPEHNPITHHVVEGSPIFNTTKQQWEQSWFLVEYTPQEMVANQAAAVKRLTDEVVTQTQARLDKWANERNYDGILSLCTYATSSVAKFKAEGQKGVDNRDATWSKLYGIMAEVEAGTRPMPKGYADIEPLLPALQWPSS